MIAALLAASLDASVLPDRWLGDWKGQTAVVGLDGAEKHKAAMSLRISKLPESGHWTWELTYGEGEKADKRPYVLKATPTPGRFDLDEKNGIVLPMGLVGDTMWSHFKVGNSLLTARYRLLGDRMEVEIPTFAGVAATTAKAGELAVEGYAFQSVQRATLTRVPPANAATK